MKDLKVFAPDHEELFKEMTLLLTFDDIRYDSLAFILEVVTIDAQMNFISLCGYSRDHEMLSGYGDTNSARMILMYELKKVIEANPLFHGKLKFPSIQSHRLRRLINQRLYFLLHSILTFSISFN
jgi:hypothetical protein